MFLCIHLWSCMFLYDALVCSYMMFFYDHIWCTMILFILCCSCFMILYILWCSLDVFLCYCMLLYVLMIIFYDDVCSYIFQWSCVFFVFVYMISYNLTCYMFVYIPYVTFSCFHMSTHMLLHVLKWTLHLSPSWFIVFSWPQWAWPSRQIIQFCLCATCIPGSCCSWF